MKDWARGKTDFAPAWVNCFYFAKEYNVRPWDVPEMPLRWWLRWQMLNKAEASRAAWNKRDGFTENDLKLRHWALLKDRYD